MRRKSNARYLCLKDIPMHHKRFYNSARYIDGPLFKFGRLYKATTEGIALIWLTAEDGRQCGVQRQELHKYFRRFI